MDKLYTFTACLFLVTCMATTCTAGSQGIWKGDVHADGYTIHIYGRMRGSQVKIIHVNVTILAETSIANLCSSTKCDLNQLLSLQPELITSDKCSLKYVCRQTCNMSKGFYRAMYKVMLQCPATHGGQTCDMRQMNVTFICKDGNRWKKKCIGPGELPPCYTSQTKETCPDIIRCVCQTETKNCTPTTTITPMTNGTTTPDTTTRTSTTSSEPTITTSSGSARNTEVSTTDTDTTASDTATDGQDGSRQMGVLVGGVVGGLFGGVVITVVIVFLCRACRSERRPAEDEDGAGTKETHTYLGLIHTTSSSGISPPGTNAVTSQVPDLIKVSAVQQASSAPSDVYDVIKEGDDNQLWVDPSACDQGDYVDITDAMPAVGLYSLAQAAPGMAVQGSTPQPAEYFVLEKDDPTDGDYNKLVRDGATETGTDVQGTYNRLGRDGVIETGTDVQGTYNRLGRDGAIETGTDVQGTYNRLIRDGATETTTDVQGTYNKLGSTTYDNDNNEPGRNIGTAADYFVLETPEDTSNKLAQAAPGIAVQDDTPPSAAEYFVLEKDDPSDGDYNKLVRDGATKTTTDVQDTYNKLGSMVDDNEDNEPGGNNGTAADYFVLEKPEDTYNKLEGKRSTEEEQEPYTKLGEATPKRESESPDDPGGPSREYFILEDQT